MANAYALSLLGSIDRHTWTFDVDGNGSTVRHTGGVVTLATKKDSTMGGGTIQWEWSIDGGTSWANIGTAVTVATTAAEHLRLAPGDVRPTLSGATGPAIKVYLV